MQQEKQQKQQEQQEQEQQEQYKQEQQEQQEEQNRHEEQEQSRTIKVLKKEVIECQTLLKETQRKYKLVETNMAVKETVWNKKYDQKEIEWKNITDLQGQKYFNKIEILETENNNLIEQLQLHIDTQQKEKLSHVHAIQEKVNLIEQLQLRLDTQQKEKLAHVHVIEEKVNLIEQLQLHIDTQHKERKTLEVEVEAAMSTAATACQDLEAKTQLCTLLETREKETKDKWLLEKKESQESQTRMETESRGALKLIEELSIKVEHYKKNIKKISHTSRNETKQKSISVQNQTKDVAIVQLQELDEEWNLKYLKLSADMAQQEQQGESLYSVIVV